MALTTVEREKLIDDLSTVFLYTEHSGNRDKLYKFSLAGGKSTYSFGLIQFDVGARSDARTFLASIGFTQAEITALSGNSPISNISNLNNKLFSNAGNVDQFILAELSKKVDKLEFLIAEIDTVRPDVAQSIRGSSILQMQLVDFDNQYNIQGISGVDALSDGSMLRFLKGNLINQPGGQSQLQAGTGLTSQNIADFIGRTQQAVQSPRDINRRGHDLQTAFAQLQATFSGSGDIVVAIGDSNTWAIGTKFDGTPVTIDLIEAATGKTRAQIQAANPGRDLNNLQVGQAPLNLPTAQNGLATTTTTTAPSITQTGTANEGAAAAAVNNGIAVANSVKTVTFSNGELNSTSVFGTLTSSIATDGIRPGNFSVLINGISTPVPSLLVNNPAQSTNVTVANTNGGSNYTLNNYGVIIPNILNSKRTYVDPLILDLNNDGVQLTSYADKTVLFDIDHDGLTAGKATLEQTGWVKANTTTGQTNNTDGIVVHDLNGNGKIDGIHETLSEFYNGVAGSNGNTGEKKYSNGFTALKSLDTGNGTVCSLGYNDNVFDNKDAAYTQLRVWVDANADGISDAGELKTLAELGITSINLAATNQSGLVNSGNEILATGSFTQTINGTNQTKQAQAVNFVANTAGSSFTASTEGVRIDT